MIRGILPALAVLATPALADTLFVTPKDPAHQPIANHFVVDPVTHVMQVPDLSAVFCAKLLIQLSGDQLVADVRCQTAEINPLTWPQGQ
jgi:hypothetical protein